MENPLRGIYLDSKFYDYVPGTFRESVPLNSTAMETQNNRTFSKRGSGKNTFTIQLNLDTTYIVKLGETEVGTTTWTGVSRLADLESVLGAKGESMPLIFVCPYGATFSVVPTGSVDVSVYNPDYPGQSSAEFYVNLTLTEA